MSDDANVWQPRTTGRPEAGQILYSDNTQTEIVNTAAETVLANVTIPAGTVAPDDKLLLTVLGSYLNNDANGRTFGWGLLLNAAGAIIVSVFPTIAGVNTSVNRRLVKFEAAINITSLVSQSASYRNELGGAYLPLNWGTIVGTPNGELSPGESPPLVENLAIASTLRLSFKHAVANANLSFISKSIVLERLPKGSFT